MRYQLIGELARKDRRARHLAVQLVIGYKGEGDGSVGAGDLERYSLGIDRHSAAGDEKHC